jgi:hypothetical protein
MNFRYVCIGISVVAVLNFTFGVSAGDPVRVTVVMTLATQDDSPVEILGFRLPKQSGGIPSIVLRNRTSKAIRHVGLTNYLGSPAGGGGTEPKPRSNFGMRQIRDPWQRSVAPNTTAEFPEGVLKPYDVGAWAHDFRSNCLHAAFVITRVEFADESVWSLDQAGEYERLRARLLESWKDSIRPESTKGCDDSLATRQVLGRLDGTAWPSGGASNISIEVVPFFAFSCPIRDDNVAWCQL